jgi:regulator of protease activity HflC (stomatin/prohibitin superfamily)
MYREKQARSSNGWIWMIVVLALLIASVYGMVTEGRAKNGTGVLIWLMVLGLTVFLACGLFIVNPNEAKVVQLFGAYQGTVKEAGLWWVNPLAMARPVSQRVRNFETPKLKVNDHDGNPIEIGAVVVWQVVDTAEAMFEVDNYENFVHVQSEAALRNMATSHPYDAHQEGQMSLRANTTEIAEHLKGEIQARLDKAGVKVIEARISHLAYAPEIASAMLRRQQASAIIAARQKIVEGAVSMVEMALDGLAKRKVVQLDEERKAAMVSNLLVVLCSDKDAHPIVNAGSLYH